MANTRLMSLKSQGLLSESHCGFQKCHSVLDDLVHFERSITYLCQKGTCFHDFVWSGESLQYYMETRQLVRALGSRFLCWSSLNRRWLFHKVPALNVKIDNIFNSSKHFMYSTDRNPNWISTFSFITVEVLFYCIKRGGLSLKIHTFCIVMLNWHSF